jgi:metal-dependent amidase/aminoacylase/carboxypeptidase family protein
MVAYYGTPAEEGGGGKILMLERGAFQGCDAAVQYHAGDHPSVATGCLAVQRIDFEYTGRPAHSAAAPWNGLNALDAVIQLFNSVNAMRQQVRPDTRIHGIVTDGGQAVNIVPERAAAAFGVRSSDSGYHKELMARMEACGRGAAEATGTTLKISKGLLFDAFKHNTTMGAIVKDNAKALGFTVEDRFVGASTDLGNLSQALPTVAYTLPTCPPGVGMHTREALEAGKAEIGLAGMMNDAKVMVMTTIDLLASPALVERAWEEFRRG